MYDNVMSDPCNQLVNIVRGGDVVEEKSVRMERESRLSSG